MDMGAENSILTIDFRMSHFITLCLSVSNGSAITSDFPLLLSVGKSSSDVRRGDVGYIWGCVGVSGYSVTYWLCVLSLPGAPLRTCQHSRCRRCSIAQAWLGYSWGHMQVRGFNEGVCLVQCPVQLSKGNPHLYPPLPLPTSFSFPLLSPGARGRLHFPSTTRHCARPWGWRCCTQRWNSYISFP